MNFEALPNDLRIVLAGPILLSMQCGCEENCEN